MSAFSIKAESISYKSRQALSLSRQQNLVFRSVAITYSDNNFLCQICPSLFFFRPLPACTYGIYVSTVHHTYENGYMIDIALYTFGLSRHLI